jgi:CubicO group peptidase (beta-lactamase class C family)
VFKTITAVFLGFVLLCVSGVAADDTFTFPNTRAGEMAKAYIAALNTGDKGTLQAFYTSHYAEASLAKRPPEERATRAVGLHGQMGGLIPALVTGESDYSVTVTARSEKMNMWFSCTFQLEEQEPYKLATVMIAPGSPPELTGDADKAWTDLADLLQQEHVDSEIPAIAAAVVEDGRVTEAVAVGVRQVGMSDKVQDDDYFHIGSITKSVTATMIGILVQDGVLEWDVTIADALGDLNPREEYHDVTLEQLLHHRGGVPGYATFDESEGTRLNSLPGTPTEQRTAFVTEVLQSEPVARAGEGPNYSNGGYVVAALMSERATATAWEQLVVRYVLDPVRMKHSGFGWPATESRPDQPRGHYYHESGFRAQAIDEYPLGNFLSPAGNIHASIGDLALYAKMHLDGLAGQDGAATAETIKRLHSPPKSQEGEMSYASGWMIVEREGLGTVHTHAGSAGTFFAIVELYPGENRAVVVAMNTGAGAGVAESIIRSINERKKAGTR